jgi:hypothetical protein
MNDSHKITGLYADPAAIARDPGFLDVAQAEIGLNCIILGGGWNLSADVRDLNPFGERLDGLAPGLTLADDDTALRRAMDEAHRRGIRVWAIICTYWAGAEHAPRLMARTLHDRRMDEFPLLPYAAEQRTHTFCPNNEQVNAWFEAALVDIATRYDVQGTALTHFRYCHPAFFEQLLGCGCLTCERVAVETGYDFDRMKAAVLETVIALQHLPADKLNRAAESGLGFFDLLLALGQDAGGLADWLNFRADAFSRNLKRFRGAVRAATGPDFSFGSDAHYPSFAALVGHRYGDLGTICDHILPLLAHNEIHCLDNLATFATLLTRWSDGLEEQTALRLAYRLFGYDRFALPETVAGLHLGNPPSAEPGLAALGDIVADEMIKARLYSGEAVPSYPVIKGAIWPAATVRRLIAAAQESGHDGIVFQGTASLFDYPPRKIS